MKSSRYSIRNFFRLSHIPKLLFLYCVGVLSPIIIDFDFSPHFWKHLFGNRLSDNKIVFYSVSDRAGEGVLYLRMKHAADKMGIDYYSVRFCEALTHFWLTKHFYQAAVKIIGGFFKPNFYLALTHHVNILGPGYNMVYLNVPRSMLFDYEGKFRKGWLKKYDAYIDLYSFVHGKNEVLQEAVKEYGEKKIIPAYLAHEYVPYQPASSREAALLTGSLWGCGRESLRTVIALKKLAADGMLVAYGLKEYLSILGKVNPNAYQGSFDTADNMLAKIQEVQNKYGIGLVIHSLEHSLEGLPTSRILESIASGAIVISDHHYFIEKFFGDNVLYFNALGGEEEIEKEISEKIKWIKNNQLVAEEKAKAAYQIFVNNFTLEKELQKIIDLANM